MSPEEYRTPGKRHRRDPGSGGLFWREDRKLWVATVEDKRLDGTRWQRTVSARSKAECIDKKNKLLNAIARGELPVTGKVTVAEWLDYWLDHIARPRLRPNTLRNYRYAISNNIAPHIGKRKLSTLTTIDVRRMQDAIFAEGKSSSVCMNAHQILAKALDDAMKEHPPLVRANVARSAGRPKVTRQGRQPLTLEQAKHLLVTADAAGDPNTARWAVYLFTGMRQGEVLGLTWDRVDLDNAVIDVAWQLQRITPAVAETSELIRLQGQWCLVPPKSAASRRLVPIIPPLLEILRRYREVAPHNRWGLLWAQTSGQPLKGDQDRDAWYAALERAELPRVVIHAARHSAITIMQALGVPEDVRMRAVGQSTVAVQRAYAHVDLALMRAEMGKMSAILPPRDM